MRKISTAGTGLAAAAVLASGATPVMAQSAADAGATLEEVVVTAEKREENLQKTAASITTRDGSELARQGRFTLQQVLQDVPGVTTYVDTPSLSTGAPAAVPSDNPALLIAIRGVPSSPQPLLGTVPTSVAYYADGIYSGMPADYDVNRVEVLRGPQGTLYGRSATSGVVAVWTQDPVLGNFAGNVMGEVASFNLGHVTGAVNLPLGDKVAVRVAVNHFERNGEVSARGYSQKSQAARLKLLYQPSDDFRLLVGYATREDHDNAGGAILQNDPTIPHSVRVAGNLPIFPNLTEQRQAWAQLDWDFGFAGLTYLPTYHTYTTHGSTVGFDGHIQADQNIPRDRTITHELRLNSSASSAIRWMVGGVHYENDQRVIFRPVWRVSQALLSQEDRSSTERDAGAFAETTLPLAAHWRFTAGLRYDSTEVQVNEEAIRNRASGNTRPNFDSPNNGLPLNLKYGSLSGPAGHLSYNNLTYKARIETDLAPQNLLYASVTTAFLPGSVSLNAVTSGTSETINATTLVQQRLTSYEVGSKNRFLDDRLQLNGSIFFYSYAGYQLIVDTDLENSGGEITISSPAQMLGAELEGEYLVTDADRVRLSIGHTNAYFVDRSATFALYSAQKTIPQVVPTSASLSYDHTFQLAGGSTLNLYNQLRYTSPYDQFSLSADQLSARPFIRGGTQWVDDINLRWTSPSSRYGATFYVNNVMDKQYIQNAYVNFFIPASGTTPQQTGVGFVNSSPRIFGVTLHADF